MKNAKQHVILLKTILIALALFAISCSNDVKETNENRETQTGQKTQEEKNTVLVTLKTDAGDITLKLYGKTKQHRENFVKLAKEGFYDGVLFHRVIKEFMIQTGDPQSKDAPADMVLGNGGPGYTIPAEIYPEYYHKKGAIAAARKNDKVNPERKSSGSQFYIVHGKTFTKTELDKMAVNMREQNINNLLFEYLYSDENADLRNRIEELKRERNADSINAIIHRLRAKVIELYPEKTKFSYTDEQIEVYTTVGGAPFLDGQYTVFGEVVEGFDVIDKIAVVKTNDYDRPIDDIKIKEVSIEE